MTHSPHPLRNKPNQAAIERLVSAYRSRKWTVKTCKDRNDVSSHPSALLSDGSYSVFAKMSVAANGLEQFESELAGLRLLAEVTGVQIPTPIGTLTVADGAILILEGVEEVERTPREWRQIGRTLAQIHRTKGQQFGLETHNYFGPLYQDNRPLADWPTFYAERRIWPRLVGAINAGHMPSEVIRKVETVILRLPHLCGPDFAPTLLHGDAQQNNFISTEEGAIVIDPAVYYGHPEMDLAYVDYFRPVPDDIFIGYQELLPIDSGFRERRELWRLYGYLAIVEVEGADYLPQLVDALSKYV